MDKKININYAFFIISIYILIFQNLLQNVIKCIQYFDECFSLLLVPVLFFKIRKNLQNDIKVKMSNFCLIILSFFILIVGIFSNVVYKYQQPKAYLIDVLLVFKFFLVYLLTQLVWGNTGFLDKYSYKIYKHTRFVLYILFVLTIFNYIFQIWPWEYRWGIMSNKLFFEHPTILAASCMFLFALLFISNKSVKMVDATICGIILLSTLRMKAIGTVIIIAAIIFYVNKTNRKLSIAKLGILAVLAIILAGEQISYYYLNNDGTARNQLTIKSFVIARDYFPVGTGFGTYASYISGKNYSPIYYMYDLDNVHGLIKGYVEFVSDTFWPMIIGQFGLIGTVCYISCLILIFREIQKTFSKNNKNIYLAKICCFVYLIIASTSESAFVHPSAIPFAIILGV